MSEFIFEADEAEVRAIIKREVRRHVLLEFNPRRANYLESTWRPPSRSADHYYRMASQAQRPEIETMSDSQITVLDDYKARLADIAQRTTSLELLHELQTLLALLETVAPIVIDRKRVGESSEDARFRRWSQRSQRLSRDRFIASVGAQIERLEIHG